MDFLTFKSFISIEALIFFYYMGAIVLPLGSWLFSMQLMQRFDLLGDAYTTFKASTWQYLKPMHKLYLLLFFIFSFLFMEFLWRMMFEFLIAFMQMRDALV